MIEPKGRPCGLDDMPAMSFRASLKYIEHTKRLEKIQPLLNLSPSAFSLRSLFYRGCFGEVCSEGGHPWIASLVNPRCPLAMTLPSPTGGGIKGGVAPAAAVNPAGQACRDTARRVPTIICHKKHGRGFPLEFIPHLMRDGNDTLGGHAGRGNS